MVFSPADIQARPGLVGSAMKRAARVSETVIRHWPLVWAGLMGLLLLGAAGKASERLLWHDELFTLYASQLSPAALWEALADGLDLQPPLGYLVTRITTSTLGDGLVAMRVPSLVGFGLGCVCLGLFVKRRVGLAGGTVALLVPSVTAGYDYAYEARPYGMLLGLTGVALLLWQATERPRSRRLAALGLAIALAIAVSLHYYGVLLVAPLAVGESLRIRRGTPGGIPVWLAMAAGCLAAAGVPATHGRGFGVRRVVLDTVVVRTGALHVPLLSLPDPTAAAPRRAGVRRVPFAVSQRTGPVDRDPGDDANSRAGRVDRAAVAADPGRCGRVRGWRVSTSLCRSRWCWVSAA